MKLKRVIGASSVIVSLGLAGLFGVGLETASADPGQPCGPNACGPAPRQDVGPGPDQRGGPGPDQRGGPAPQDIDQRGIDQGRQDHQPFTYMGQHVNPVFDNDRGGWGFWFFNVWIPL
jgi:hypothetical protein